jgi:hypothetical protein
VSGSTVNNVRRYYLLKKQAAAALGDAGLEAVWLGKQQAEAGTSLPADFVMLSVLSAAGYSTVEDLTGASLDELREAGLTPAQANAVVAALAAL